jgi:hypothetical protein
VQTDDVHVLSAASGKVSGQPRHLSEYFPSPVSGGELIRTLGSIDCATERTSSVIRTICAIVASPLETIPATEINSHHPAPLVHLSGPLRIGATRCFDRSPSRSHTAESGDRCVPLAASKHKRQTLGSLHIQVEFGEASILRCSPSIVTEWPKLHSLDGESSVTLRP